jgi:hypothetical protein
MPVTLLIAGASVACQHETNDPTPATAEAEDTSLANDGADANLAESDPELLTSSLVSSPTLGVLGLATAANLQAVYLPRGCVTVSADPTTSTETYTFNKCVGPNGLRQVTGTVTAQYRTVGSTFTLDLVGTNSINRAVVEWHATADVTHVGADRTMKWTAQLNGTTAGLRSFARSTTHTISWRLGDVCYALDGASEGKISGRDITTQITNFHRCHNACPDAGGKITVTNTKTMKQVVLQYDGSGSATFILPNGTQRAVVLPCSLL